MQQAVLQLNPAELGPVAIHIALDGARAHVDFTAPHAVTLAGGGVFDRPREQADGNAGAPAWAGDTRRQDAPRGEALPPPIVLPRRGVVDLVA
ncbi:MAG: flagellar hook-length control protein FliK [Burkholderiaceae bacterium]|nr:flagellar hook-length control protein FliK [Burkholderiaceae bacterium]